MDTREFRDMGHRVVDLVAAYLEGVEERPLFPKVEPRTLEALFDEPLPAEPQAPDALLREIEEKLLPYCIQVNHPGYFGYMTPTPAPVGVLADFLASALNQNVGFWSIGPSAVAIERQTVRWLDGLVGYGPRSGGNLTSGGTMANFIALKLARDFASGDRAQIEGVRDRWAAYVSEERHVSIDKAVDAVGAGREGLRALPTDDAFRVRIDALEEALARDRASGVRPMCVIGLAGTTNTGSIDDLRALRRIADREKAWFHVDAAYGGGMLLSREHPGLLEGLASADSITLDPHKWFYAPLDAGAILVKEEERLTRSFGMRPSYLADPMDPKGERYAYFVHGFEQSRRFRSLKVWMSFKRYGAAEIGRWVDANVAQAERLHALAEAHPHFLSATPPRMSAICLRYEPRGLEELAPLHAEVARRIEKGGRFWVSTTVLKGKTFFRINPVNFRTRLEHVEAFFEALGGECEKTVRESPVG